MKKRYLVVFLIVLSIISIFIGASRVDLEDVISLDPEAIEVFSMARLPRLVSIVIAGMGMGIAGLIMQQISHNKFVSPTTATTVDSAKMGVLFSMIFFNEISSFGRMVLAFIFALGGTFLFMGILGRIKVKNQIFIPLVGMMLGNIIDSITTFFAYRYDLVQNISTWLQGDFSMVIKGRYELLYISLPLIALAFTYANRFTVAGMGEDFASNLGVNYDLVVNVGIIIVALISSLVIISVGRIPFLGLVIPNIVSIFQGDNMENNIWHTGLFGAIFLLLADIIGRLVIYPYEIPISLTVGVFGSIIFLYLVLRGDRND